MAVISRSLAALAALLAIACAVAERPSAAEQLTRANEVAEAYVQAAARGDIERVCALRTAGALKYWGGRAACERRAEGLAIGPLPRDLRPQLAQNLIRRASRIDAQRARVLAADSSLNGDEARVVVDFGVAFLEDGHAVGGEILEVDLKREAGEYRVARVGLAAFAD